ncbi:DUF3224 domain-containing protein [Nocardia inohanensis]|uniref:DUF3224 domain-containing protein n=1 Tax=Nocardia inohanensis TaxID=209246 RepID=UPI0008358FCD|nr:DUF3224 domain-containing protein [Nocardia inohanensis]
MRATGTFTVKSFVPAEITAEPVIPTAVPVGLAVIEKQFEGEVVGRSTTLFTSAFDPAAGAGTYVAMESFEGSLNGVAGSFNFVHSATTTGDDRTAPFFTIVPVSGTGGLAGIRGTGDLVIDDDGTHHMWFEYELG